MKVKITYWTAGDSKTSRIVEIEDESGLQAAIEELVDDPQEPLSQVDKVELV